MFKWENRRASMVRKAKKQSNGECEGGQALLDNKKYYTIQITKNHGTRIINKIDPTAWKSDFQPMHCKNF